MVKELIKNNPEKEDYYRNLYKSFIQSLREAVETNNPSANEIVESTKSFFEKLLNGNQDEDETNLESELRKTLSKSSKINNDNLNENSDEKELSTTNKNETEMADIENMVQQLIEKHPENEDFYQKLYEAFIGVIQQAISANSEQVPGIIRATKMFFNELLEDQHSNIDFNIGDKLREILSSVNTNQQNDNENYNTNANDQDNSTDDKNKQITLKSYKSEINDIKNMVKELIKNNPEKEDYYRNLYKSFIQSLREAVETNNPSANEIVESTKSFFEKLLNGNQDEDETNLESELRKTLSKSSKDFQANYENEIVEIQDLVQDLIEKHPENEDYYRKLYEAFMRIAKEAAEANSSSASPIIRATKSIFEDLYNDDAKSRLDFDFEDKLRSIISESEAIYNPYEEIENDDENEANSKDQKFEKLYPPAREASSKKSSTVPNYQTILNALRFTCIPGPRFTKQIETISASMKENKDERFVILMASRTNKFKGVYILASDGLSAKKMWGEGPKNIKNEDCFAYFKYINGQKIFDPLQIKGFTQTTDGFSLKKNIEPDTW
ncbi:hypothetical protein M9Y10_000585 [Tritrichomonas musculus]|uniref:CKK domain-containing protein n=1 Tax=Tritrichomonas musculus TaxID=1915356 RepID=A0ABR2L511_9EUKA